jgi:DNA topoisomerase IB
MSTKSTTKKQAPSVKKPTSDAEVFRLLDEARRQFGNFLEIQSAIDDNKYLVPDPRTYSWERPVTLTLAH